MFENVPLGDGPCVLHVDQPLTIEVSNGMQAYWDKLFPDRKLLILGPGLRLQALPSPGQLDRIERQLGDVFALLSALVAQLGDEDEEPKHDLDGNPNGAARDDSLPL